MLIKVKVQASAKKEELIKKNEDAFEAKVREKAERGIANKRIRTILAEYFKLPLSKIILIKGSKEKNKIFEIRI
ncbi:MAG: DUF167 domain-containing protein [Candidatus Paceibacterota bacterium]|jgi:hypothetical protein|nr:DUF167 domain-containing protein [Candidatus Paceibacterota bacterium]MDD5555349.1 DUF167 domain-containing protein [Candidatus Paceibacterota bacterium]